jgi:hypothetical protein
MGLHTGGDKILDCHALSANAFHQELHGVDGGGHGKLADLSYRSCAG